MHDMPVAMINRARTLRQDLETQRDFVRERVPVYARLLELLHDELERGLEARLVRTWAQRSFGAFYERPLLILAALRDDALRSGKKHPLFQALVAEQPLVSAVTQKALTAALDDDCEQLWANLAQRYVQTNESTRAVAWLWPAALAGRVVPQRGISIIDIGASAGLNLVADQLSSVWQDQHGNPIEVGPTAPVVSRLGFDLRPMDARDPADARWLQACVWPGQLRRQARLRTAIDALCAMDRDGANAVELHQAGMADVPSRLPQGDNTWAIAYQTIVRDYVAEDEWHRYVSGMERWLLSRPAGSALWIEHEMTTAAQSAKLPAALTAHVHVSGVIRTLVLAYCEPHPQLLDVQESAVAELLDVLVG